MAREHKGSMRYQVIERLKSLDRTGHSKKEAKQLYRERCQEQGVTWNPAKADGIYSFQTFEAYKKTAMDFTSWLISSDIKLKDINLVKQEQVIAYLQQRQTEGKSAWTLSKDLSALNKVFGFELKKEDAGLIEKRSYKNITRSREERSYDSRYNPKNYENQILIARAFGVRRESIVGGQYQIKDLSLFKHEGRVYCSVIEKGGRYREAPCLPSMQEKVLQAYPNIQNREKFNKEQFKQLYHTSQVKLFEKYTTKIDNHAFRAEYAQKLYTGLAKGKQGNEKLFRGYDQACLKEVSQALGHNRLSVVVENYLK
ncbi:site-specific integrase [Gottfriedia luciferensis]|uniref:site-specific integrase n=1 Tax=Gottfriedia luciferensis TaxID=178774 RepID=UPI0013029C58|nr:site-specific integrase [Gottfriedia luciferensis]